MDKRLAIIVAASLAAVLAGAPIAAAQQPPRVDARIDFSKPDILQDQIVGLSAALTQRAPAIFLDLKIGASGTDGDYDYRTEGTLANGDTVDLDCANGFERKAIPLTEVSFGFSPDYNHLLLRMVLDPERPSPFLTIGCEYDSTSPGEWLLTFEGYFAVSIIDIPTANDVELRSVEPAVAP